MCRATATKRTRRQQRRAPNPSPDPDPNPNPNPNPTAGTRPKLERAASAIRAGRRPQEAVQSLGGLGGLAVGPWAPQRRASLGGARQRWRGTGFCPRGVARRACVAAVAPRRLARRLALSSDVSVGFCVAAASSCCSFTKCWSLSVRLQRRPKLMLSFLAVCSKTTACVAHRAHAEGQAKLGRE